MHTPTQPTRRPKRPGRGTGSRPPLPAGRAVVGALLITLSAVLVLVTTIAADDLPDTQYQVARRTIDVGEVIGADDIVDVAIDLPPDVADEAFSSRSSLVGALALAPVNEGQLFSRSGIRIAVEGGDDATADAQPIRRQFSFSVDRSRALDGQLSRGEHVDVLATYGGAADATTVVVARDITIVRVSDQGKGGIGGGGGITLTVAVDDPDKLTGLAHATSVGAITIVRSTGAHTAAGAIEAYRHDDEGEGDQGSVNSSDHNVAETTTPETTTPETTTPETTTPQQTTPPPADTSESIGPEPAPGGEQGP